MSVRRFSLGIAALAMCAAVAMALPSRASRVEAVPDRVAIKGDRLDIHPVSSVCLQDSWPYGCQWQAAATDRLRHQGPRNARNQQRERHARGVVQVSTWKRQLAMPGKSVF
jgi:hypothetical protein